MSAMSSDPVGFVTHILRCSSHHDNRRPGPSVADLGLGGRGGSLFGRLGCLGRLGLLLLGGSSLLLLRLLGLGLLHGLLDSGGLLGGSLLQG